MSKVFDINIKMDTPWEEARDTVLAHPLWDGVSAEEAIRHAEELHEKNPDKPKNLWLLMYLRDHMITGYYKHGGLTLGVIGGGDGPFNRFIIYRGDNPKHWVMSSFVATPEKAAEYLKKLGNIYEEGYQEVYVNFPTGDLVFGNFFAGLDDLPEELKHTKEYSINHELGVSNTADWLAENRNLAYAQTGNTSFDVYKISDKQLALVGFYEEDYEPPGKWKKIGHISCEMWRVEFVDRQSFKDNNFDFEAYKKECDYMEFGEVKVQPGVWRVTNSWAFREENVPIFLELTDEL